MPALVSKVLVTTGDSLTLGDPVVMLESTKPFDPEAPR